MSVANIASAITDANLVLIFLMQSVLVAKIAAVFRFATDYFSLHIVKNSIWL